MADGAPRASWTEFDVHGVARIRVARDAPTEPYLREMLAPFLSSGLPDHHMTVTTSLPPLDDAADAEDAYRYSPAGLDLHRQRAQVRVTAAGYDVAGSAELLTTVLPLLDRIATTNGAAMVHAATVDHGGVGICMPAWGGVGKTSTVAKLMRRPGVRFLGDDWAFLTSGGSLLGYAKPMFVKPHHRPIYPHLFAGGHKPLVPPRLTGPLARVATAVHPAITRYPRLATLTRHWSPEHMMVTPEKAFPQHEVATSAPLGAVVFVERFGGDRPRLSERPRRWVIGRMVGNFHVEMPRQSRDLVAALAATGIVPLDTYFGDKTAVLEAAIGSLPTFLLQVPRVLSADDASDAIVAGLDTVLARSEPREAGRA